MAAKRANPAYAKFEAKTRAEWRRWLRKHHADTRGIWLVTYKKASGEPHLSAQEAAEEAVAFGWVDSLPRTLDATRSMLLMTPRKRGSSWSNINKKRAQKLIVDGRMAQAGLEKIKAAKRDGSWSRLNAVEALRAPPDLMLAFRSKRKAKNYFDEFPRSVKRGILEWILNAKRPETRAARIAETVRQAGRNVRANQYRQ